MEKDVIRAHRHVSSTYAAHDMAQLFQAQSPAYSSTHACLSKHMANAWRPLGAALGEFLKGRRQALSAGHLLPLTAQHIPLSPLLCAQSIGAMPTQAALSCMQSTDLASKNTHAHARTHAHPHLPGTCFKHSFITGARTRTHACTQTPTHQGCALHEICALLSERVGPGAAAAAAAAAGPAQQCRWQRRRARI